MAALTVKQVIASRINLRDKRSALKKAFTAEDDRYKELEAQCDAWLLKKAKEVGVTQFKENGIGTAYQSETMHVGIGSEGWPAMHEWVAQDPATRLDIFERRISKSFVQAYMDANAGATPPALNITRELSMNVRRDSTNTSGDTSNGS